MIEWTLVKASLPFATRDLSASPPPRRAVADHRRSRVLDRSREPLPAWHRRGGLRPGRRRAGARRRRVRHHRRSRDGARHLCDGARLMEPEIVQRFLESVGAKADIDLYLKLFRSQRKESFAILAPNAQIVKSALDPVHFDLRILRVSASCPSCCWASSSRRTPTRRRRAFPTGCWRTPSPARSSAPTWSSAPPPWRRSARSSRAARSRWCRSRPPRR